MPGAGDRVDPQLLAHDRPLQSASSAGPAGTGRNGRPVVAVQPPWRWHRISAANSRSALRTNLTAPSGWWHAPRPLVSPAHRSRSLITEPPALMPASSV